MELPPSFFLFVVSAAFTPGPNNIMIMSSGLNFGVRASIPHFLGICFGVPTMFLAIGLGMGFLFERYSLLHEFIQIAGILYLVYLAWLIANAAPTSLDDGRSKPLSFPQAALFQWINPKAWMMGTSAIAAYTTVGADVGAQVVFIAGVFLLVAFPSAGVWMVFGVGLKKVLAEPEHLRIFNKTMALLLVASVLPVVIELFEKYFG